MLAVQWHEEACCRGPIKGGEKKKGSNYRHPQLAEHIALIHSDMEFPGIRVQQIVCCVYSWKLLGEALWKTEEERQ